MSLPNILWERKGRINAQFQSVFVNNSKTINPVIVKLFGFVYFIILDNEEKISIQNA